MNVLVVQHVPDERPYLIGDALEARGLRVRVCRIWAGETPPADLTGYRALVVMGGPASAYDTGAPDLPTRGAELDLLRVALHEGVPVLGVCLGAQLLAVAAGGVARPGEGLQVGWGSVRKRSAAEDDVLFAGLPARHRVLHWHGDTMDLPAGAALLASCDRYEVQAFRVGDVAWGLQYHIEVDEPAVGAFVAAFPEEAATAPGLRENAAAELAALAPHRAGLLDRFAKVVAER